MRFDKAKEQVVIEDDEAKGELEKKEHVDDTWQDDEIFKKMSAKKSKGMDQYVDLGDGNDELKLKQAILVTYKMPKVAKYDGNGDLKLYYMPLIEFTQVYEVGTDIGDKIREDKKYGNHAGSFNKSRNRLGLGYKFGTTLKKTYGWLDMDGLFIRSSDHSSSCLPIEPFKHKGKTHPGLKIFANVIDMLVVEPKEPKFEEEKGQKEEEKTPEKEGLRGYKRPTKKERKRNKEKDKLLKK
ncbi:hypothetical protein JCGZ_20012 [Jatropha curcas]|uniref:Uncharacterized protein n=1 Tax=Jatropha curcas TaxID=180498 RepID=A0A067JUA5_JATCU|nr:hypothetical protein JCGZ_20012 [Jatropha curcas]